MSFNVNNQDPCQCPSCKKMSCKLVPSSVPPKLLCSECGFSMDLNIKCEINEPVCDEEAKIEAFKWLEENRNINNCINESRILTEVFSFYLVESFISNVEHKPFINAYYSNTNTPCEDFVVNNEIFEVVRTQNKDQPIKNSLSTYIAARLDDKISNAQKLNKTPNIVCFDLISDPFEVIGLAWSENLEDIIKIIQQKLTLNIHTVYLVTNRFSYVGKKAEWHTPLMKNVTGLRHNIIQVIKVTSQSAIFENPIRRITTSQIALSFLSLESQQNKTLADIPNILNGLRNEIDSYTKTQPLIIKQ